MFHKALPVRALILGLLLYAGQLSAEVLDGGEVRFGGLVMDEGPRWIWRVATPDQSWAVDIASARTIADKLHFDLHHKGTLPLLEGRLREVADRGGPGFSPLVTFSSQEGNLLLLDGSDTTRGRFQAAVLVTDPESGQPVGQLAFTLEQGMAAAFGPQSSMENTSTILPGMSLLTGETVTHLPVGGLSQTLMTRLSSLLLQTSGWKSGMGTIFNDQILFQRLLDSGDVTNIAAAYASSLSDFELTLPVEDTPAQWQARIGVMVTVQ
ncbi:fimbrial protein [Citrobacter freundii]|nr:fimbrial protein [Citrobacter freundii]